MALLHSIRIKNFRSIVDETIVLDDFNCFVGKNDSGKSNVLKALNLFFNGKTDFNTEFDFQNDYSKYAKQGAHQAKEITISVEISVPESFKENGLKTWTKVWRSDGLHYNNLNELFAGRNKAITFLSRIVYLYIPAVKSSEYFRYLLSEVYSSMTNTADSTLRGLNDKYSKELQALTIELTKDIKSVLNIESSIQMPQNLNVLFRDLSFSTNDGYIKGVDLDHRGDGIKARHIPSILRYMQKNLEKYRAKNAIVYSHIWGYEEPENGIEFLSCFDMASELYSYKSDSQLLITTHSPAFYSAAQVENSFCYFVYKSENGYSRYTREMDTEDIDQKIGLMPLVSPYILKERMQYLDELNTKEKVIAELSEKISRVKNKVFVITEGKTDTKHLKIAFRTLGIEKEFVEQIEYYDFGAKDTLGDDLKTILDRMSHLKNVSTIIGLYDRDKAICEMEGKPYQCLGNRVYKTNIPALSNGERSIDDQICIENYYTNNEIKKTLDTGRLYMGNDFNRFGLSEDCKWCFQGREKNTSIKEYSIIDSANKHLQRMAPDARMATKDDFAEYVLKHPSEFDFNNFVKILDLIKQIANENQ